MVVIKNIFFASCSSSSSANVAVELDSIFASAKHRDSGFNCAWQDVVNSQPLSLNSNLEETLLYK